MDSNRKVRPDPLTLPHGRKHTHTHAEPDGHAPMHPVDRAHWRACAHVTEMALRTQHSYTDGRVGPLRHVVEVKKDIKGAIAMLADAADLIQIQAKRSKHTCMPHAHHRSHALVHACEGRSSERAVASAGPAAVLPRDGVDPRVPDADRRRPRAGDSEQTNNKQTNKQTNRKRPGRFRAVLERYWARLGVQYNRQIEDLKHGMEEVRC